MKNEATPVRSQCVPLVAQRQPNARLVLFTIREDMREIIGHIPDNGVNSNKSTRCSKLRESGT